MRLCNALIQILLFTFLFQFTCICYGHEYHNHIDPVTRKYSQSIPATDSHTKNIETENIQHDDFYQHNDDEHTHDTIDDRLLAKHNLRESVHHHSDDDLYEDEEDYINQLNSALENDDRHEHQFEFVAPPVENIIDKTPSQHQINQNVQEMPHTQNETTYSPPTLIKTPTEQQQQHTNDRLSSTKEIPPNVNKRSHVPTPDEEIKVQVISDSIVSPIEVQAQQQKPIDPIQQNIIKEDIVFIHKETISSTQSQQQQQQIPNVAKPITDQFLSSSDQQSAKFNTIVNDTSPDHVSLDGKPRPSTPPQLDQPQQPIVDSAQKFSSSDLKPDQRQQQPTVDSTQKFTSTDRKSDEQQQPIVEPTQRSRSFDDKSNQQQQPIVDPTQKFRSSDLKPNQQQPTVDSTQKFTSTDRKSDEQQQPIVEPTQRSRSFDDKSNQQQQPTVDSTQNFKSFDDKLDQQQQQQQTVDPTQKFDSFDRKSDEQQQPIVEPTQRLRSFDAKSDQQQQPIVDPTQELDPSDRKPDQQQQQDISKSTQNSRLLDRNSEQQQTVDAIQHVSSLDQNPSSSASIKPDVKQQVSDSIENISSSDQQQKIPEVVQDINSIDDSTIPVQRDQHQKLPEAVQNTNPRDDNTFSSERNQPPEVINTMKSKETIPIDTNSDDISSVQKEPPTLAQTMSPPARILRPATSRFHQNAHSRHHHSHSHSDQEIKQQPQESENISTIENVTSETTLPITMMPIIEQSFEKSNQSIESLSLKPEEPHVETDQQVPIDLDIKNETQTQIHDQNKKSLDDITDLPRQVHVHDSSTILNELKEELKEDLNKPENLLLNEEVENDTTVASFLANDHSPHLPRILENDETSSTIVTTIQTIENNNEINQNLTEIHSNSEETNNSIPSKSNSSPTISLSNTSDKTSLNQYRQICWRLPKPFEPSLQLIENQILRFVNLLPSFLQTILIGHTNDREILINTIWFGSICTICFFFSFIFLSMGAKRLKQSKHEKEFRIRCQQLQQHNNQIELERATFEKQNQKLSDEIDELKNLPLRDTDEELFELRGKCERIHSDWKNARTECDMLQKEIDHRQSLIQKLEFEMQKQVETVAYLNNENLHHKQELEKEREIIARLQSNDLSLERFEKLQETIHELKSEITQLKQEKFIQIDQLQEVQEHAKQLDIDNNELTIKMKQLKDLLEQKDETISRIRQTMLNNNDEDEEKIIGDLLSTVRENSPDDDEEQQKLLLTIDNNVEKASQHMRDLLSEMEEKSHRIKEFDLLLNQEKDRCRELETKLKVVLELRERDAHLHIRQLGQTDAELRKARTDTERVRILQQQLELKQQQLDDVQKVLTSEQTKFSEECSKLQHETHEKWMEVKRVTRELDGARKECESLRKQITKYANSERSSQEKAMLKPVPQHINNTGRMSSEPETNGSSPPPLPYQQGDNFRPIDRERSDSGAASPAEMMRIRPPLFGLGQPPFYPPPFLPPPPNPFMMVPRFPMPMGGPHGMISPIPHLMTNGSGGGSDANSFEIVDSTNITPNSISYDAQLNGSAVSPTPDDEQQTAAKAKKSKKSLKKKTKTSTTTVMPATKEDV